MKLTVLDGGVVRLCDIKNVRSNVVYGADPVQVLTRDSCYADVFALYHNDVLALNALEVTVRERYITGLYDALEAIEVPPVAVITADVDHSVPVGDTVVMDGSGSLNEDTGAYTGFLTYEWFLDNVSLGTAATLAVTPIIHGYKEYVLVVTNTVTNATSHATHVVYCTNAINTTIGNLTLGVSIDTKTLVVQPVDDDYFTFLANPHHGLGTYTYAWSEAGSGAYLGNTTSKSVRLRLDTTMYPTGTNAAFELSVVIVDTATGQTASSTVKVLIQNSNVYGGQIVGEVTLLNPNNPSNTYTYIPINAVGTVSVVWSLDRPTIPASTTTTSLTVVGNPLQIQVDFEPEHDPIRVFYSNIIAVATDSVGNVFTTMKSLTSQLDPIIDFRIHIVNAQDVFAPGSQQLVAELTTPQAESNFTFEWTLKDSFALPNPSYASLNNSTILEPTLTVAQPYWHSSITLTVTATETSTGYTATHSRIIYSSRGSGNTSLSVPVELGVNPEEFAGSSHATQADPLVMTPTLFQVDPADTGNTWAWSDSDASSTMTGVTTGSPTTEVTTNGSVHLLTTSVDVTGTDTVSTSQTTVIPAAPHNVSVYMTMDIDMATRTLTATAVPHINYSSTPTFAWSSLLHTSLYESPLLLLISSSGDTAEFRMSNAIEDDAYATVLCNVVDGGTTYRVIGNTILSAT